MQRLPFMLCVVIFIAITATADDQASPSPEDTFRRFMSGMVKNDAEAVKATTLPTDDVDVLWQGKPPPQEAIPQIEKSLASLKLIRIQGGETVPLPGGKRFTVNKADVDDNNIFVWVEVDNRRMPTPFKMVHADGVWKIDPTPIIAGRKAAARAMQHHQDQ